MVVSAVTCPGDSLSTVPAGNWGGDHIGMVVTDTGATIEYDCASGTINEPLRLDAFGNFDWRGVHRPGHGGPILIDDSLGAHAARYTGHATADQMTITLAVTDTTFAEQTFTLQRGGAPRVFKCL